MEQSVPKRRHIKFRRRGITQKKARNKTYNILKLRHLWLSFMLKGWLSFLQQKFLTSNTASRCHHCQHTCIVLTHTHTHTHTHNNAKRRGGSSDFKGWKVVFILLFQTPPINYSKNAFPTHNFNNGNLSVFTPIYFHKLLIGVISKSHKPCCQQLINSSGSVQRRCLRGVTDNNDPCRKAPVCYIYKHSL